jgi:cobalt-zinc-cadmium efflux system membrane fusion protein
MIRNLQLLLGQGFRFLGVVLPLALLAGLALWGYANDWKVQKSSEVWQQLAKLWGASGPGDREPAEAEADTPLPIDESRPTEATPPAKPPLLEFPSLAVLRRAGVVLARVEERPMVERVSAYGVLDYDQTRYAHLSTRAPGIVWRVLKTVGNEVKKGDVMAIIDASDLGKAKADFLLDLVQLSVRTKNLQQLQSSPVSMPERTVRDAEAAVRETRVRLFNDQQALINLGLKVRIEDFSNLPEQQAARQLRVLGLAPELLEGHDPEALPATLLPMKAPFEGVVVNRDIVNGEKVAPLHDRPQFVLADVRLLTMLIEVRLEDVGRVAVGQEIMFHPDDGGDSFAGKLCWLSVEADSKTRTVKARADLPNPDGRLRPQTFGTATIQVRSRPHALAVPGEAIQSDGQNPIVFVQVGERAFEARQVELGITEGKYTEIRKGVRAGELVVRAGSHVLKAELFKDRIGGDE